MVDIDSSIKKRDNLPRGDANFEHLYWAYLFEYIYNEELCDTA